MDCAQLVHNTSFGKIQNTTPIYDASERPQTKLVDHNSGGAQRKFLQPKEIIEEPKNNRKAKLKATGDQEIPR